VGSSSQQKPRLAAGFRLSGTSLHFQLAPDRSAKSDQTRSEQAQRTRLRNDDVGVATRNAGASVKESLASVDGQLNRRALAGTRRGHQGSSEGVVVSPIGESGHAPGHRTGECAREQGAVGNSVGAVASNGEPAACSEGAAVLQRTALQSSGLEAHATQIGTGDKPRITVDGDQDRSTERESAVGAR
jgi:hypothetical protein